MRAYNWWQYSVVHPRGTAKEIIRGKKAREWKLCRNIPHYIIALPSKLSFWSFVQMWITIANRYISQLPFDWDKIKKMLLLDRFNPDEEALGAQIVKDLHRTGCSGFCGEHNEKERYLLQRVLLAYARFRPSVGYCQGFNIIAAVILDVVDKDEENALKVTWPFHWPKLFPDSASTLAVLAIYRKCGWRWTWNSFSRIWQDDRHGRMCYRGRHHPQRS